MHKLDWIIVLNTLTASEITKLLASGGYKRRATQVATTCHFARDPQGVLVRVAGKPPAGTIGKFEGKVGTTRRSRKGRTYHAPNGSRKYIAPYEQEVVMY